MTTQQNQPRMIYGTAWKEGETTRLVRQAIAAGFRAVDTANQPKHYQEKLAGDAIADGTVARAELFLQTKFTPADGQDSRIPYDPKSDYAVQVERSFESSLEHLRTDYLDSYLLHGPYTYPGLGKPDWEVWGAMEQLVHSGKVKQIGISNVNAEQLKALVAKAQIAPAAVQNRCYANREWDRPVREICIANGISYQGFSLLTANPAVVNHSFVAGLANKLGRTAEQVIYRFTMQLGMVVLTGTTDPAHMGQALQTADFELSESEVRTIETLR